MNLEKIMGKETDRIFSTQNQIPKSTRTNTCPVCKETGKIRGRARLEKLLRARESRKWIIPRDNKRVTAWNALLLKAFVDASIALESKEYLNMGCKLAEWMKENLLDQEGNLQCLLYENQDHSSGNPAFLDDYAFWAEGLLALSSVSEWIHPGSSITYLREAETLASKAMDVFRDEQSAGFFRPQGLGLPRPRPKNFGTTMQFFRQFLMLRVFATFTTSPEKLHGKGTIAKLERLFRPGSQVPHGIGHALTAIAENETGFAAKSDEKIGITRAKPPQSPIARFPRTKTPG